MPLLFFHVGPSNPPTMMGVALCHRETGRSWTTDEILVSALKTQTLWDVKPYIVIGVSERLLPSSSGSIQSKKRAS